MHEAMLTLPPLDPLSLPQVPVEPGKRPWETSKTGYVNWAVGQLVEKSREEITGTGAVAGEQQRTRRSKLDVLCATVEDIGAAQDLRELMTTADAAPAPASEFHAADGDQKNSTRHNRPRTPR